MKKIFIMILFFIVAISNAQNKTSIIYYDFTHQTDTLIKTKIKKENFKLLFNQNLSLYKSIKQEEYDSIFPIIGTQKEIEFNQTGKFDMTGMPPKGNPNQYYTLLKTKETLMKVVFNKIDYLVEEHNVIKWEIFEDTKTILDKNCQKAKCYFKGRNYTAWFTNEIPASVGPWKLNGLPGAILEVVDDKNEVSFIAYKFKVASKSEIAISSNIEKITKKEFNAVQKALKDNPQLSNSNIKLSKVGGNSNVNKSINNPLELKD